EEAARLARSVAGQLAGRERLPESSELRQLAPGAAGAAIVDAAGVPLVQSVDLPFVPIPATGSVGPDASLPDSVAGFALLPGRRWVRIDLGAEVLATQRRVLKVLMISVLTINGALIVLVVAFLGHLLAPYEALLARARAMAGHEGAEGDEMQFLLETFEEALDSLAGRDARRAEDDIAALERTLAPSLQSGLLLLDRDGHVLALNTVGAELLGISPPAPGTPLAEVLAGQPELHELLAGAVASGSAPSRAECDVRSGRGEALTVGLTVHPLRRDDGGTRGFLVLFADLTEVRKRAEESRLAESLARLGEM